jgi:phosphoglycolate phosphatase
MNNKGRIKAILFDLDGTLIDSAPDLHLAANKLLAEQNRRPVELQELTDMIGDGVTKLVERAFEATGEAIPEGGLEDLTKRYLEFYEPHCADLTIAYPGAIDCLKQLRDAGYPLAVCTNKPYAATLEILEGLGLAEFFEVVIGGDTLPGIKKPDPRHLLAALDRLGVSPEQVVMVGDNANDVNAARGAGIPVIVCRFGYTKGPAENLKGDLIIDHFDDLVDAIRDFGEP